MCHKNPDLWEKPNELYPEHFLDKKGNLDSKKEAFMPFSVGQCYYPIKQSNNICRWLLLKCMYLSHIILV